MSGGQKRTLIVMTGHKGEEEKRKKDEDEKVNVRKKGRGWYNKI